jgi:pyridoxine 5'-phosphate synthase PdxJ
MMTQVAHSSVYNNSGTISRETETTTTSEAQVIDLLTGNTADLKKVRIKINTQEEQAIGLLLAHYSQKLGKDITLSQLVALLVNKSLNDSLNIDLSFLSKALSVGLKVEMPQVSFPQFGGKV